MQIALCQPGRKRRLGTEMLASFTNNFPCLPKMLRCVNETPYFLFWDDYSNVNTYRSGNACRLVYSYLAHKTKDRSGLRVLERPIIPRVDKTIF